MNELASRLSTFIDFIGVSQRFLCQKTGITAATMSRMINGQSDISIDLVKYLILNHRMSSDWFYAGIGDPVRPSLDIAREPAPDYGGDAIEEFRRLVRILTEIERRLPPSTL